VHIQTANREYFARHHGSYHGSPVVSFALHEATKRLIAITIMHLPACIPPGENHANIDMEEPGDRRYDCRRDSLVRGKYVFSALRSEREYLHPGGTHTICPWKGVERYYGVVVDGQVNGDAAWNYSEPSSMAARTKDHAALWHGVKMEG